MGNSLSNRPTARPSRWQGPTSTMAPLLAYEQMLNQDPRWALTEGSRHFEEKSAVHEALRKIARRLEEMGIPYAIAGGMALFVHGLRRFTEDVDILVEQASLKKIHKELDGLGYRPPFAGSRNLRDTALGVRIEFLVTGQYPGDGRSKPIAFPEPASVAIERDGIKYLQLTTLVELKLASGMTSPERMKDLGDVQELIKLLDLPLAFGARLSPYVQGKYEELWHGMRQATRRYILLWRNKWLTSDAKTVEEMAAMLHDATERLEAMKADGVTLDPHGGTGDDYARLVTTDPEIAKKYDMHDESEFLDPGEDEGEEEEKEGVPEQGVAGNEET